MVKILDTRAEPIMRLFRVGSWEGLAPQPKPHQAGNICPLQIEPSLILHKSEVEIGNQSFVLVYLSLVGSIGTQWFFLGLRTELGSGWQSKPHTKGDHLEVHHCSMKQTSMYFCNREELNLTPCWICFFDFNLCFLLLLLL